VPDSTAPWPEGCRGALSLTFDDGGATQLARGIPLMNELGLRGTFYLCPRGDNWKADLEAWRPAYEAGHEIGNHSVSHICSRGFGADPNARGLENITLTEVEADILLAEDRLSEVFPYPGQRSFCYPCFQNFVGEGEQRQSYTPIIAKHFIAGRGLGEVPNHPATADLHYLWSWMVRGNTAMELIGMAEQCANRGRWGIMTFHGIHEGHLSIASCDFHELCEHLAKAHHIWVAPVKEIAATIVNWREGLA
jgi:peptidoglycan-N-acetylglucosamine deacetylase